jgi:methionine-rich copper-binding protein CopC
MRMRNWWTALAAGLLVVLVGAVPAGAHSDLASSDPADGAVLAEAPASVSFTFNERLLPQGNAITLTDTATGERLDLPDTAVDGDTVSVPWPSGAPAGEYRAAYRVVSADGHPIAGSITFTVEGQASPAASPEPAASTPAPSPPEPSNPASSTPEPAVATPLATPEPVAAAEADADVNAAVWALGVGVLVLGAVGGATWYARRNRRA